MEKILYYTGRGNHHLASSTLIHLGEYYGKELSFSHIDIAEYSDEECDDKFPHNEEIEGRKLVYFQSIYNRELLEEALGSIWALKRQYKAKYLIAVIPFLMFRRQDHEEKMDEVCRLRMIIDRLKHAGVDEIITVSPHSPKMKLFCDEFGILMRELDPSPLFSSAIKTYLDEIPEIYAPDKGSIVRAIGLAKLTGSRVIFSLKERGLNNAIQIKAEDEEEIAELIKYYQEKFNYSDISYADVEHIKDQVIVVTEDEVCTGETANSTGDRLKELGARLIIFLAMHPVLVRSWRRKLLDNNPFDKILMGNTIPRDYSKRTGGLIHDIFVEELLAQVLYKSLQQLIKKIDQ